MGHPPSPRLRRGEPGKATAKPMARAWAAMLSRGLASGGGGGLDQLDFQSDGDVVAD
jgi:hypothetical protein